MVDQKVYVLGYDEIVLMLGLLGIEGTTIENANEFMQIFNELIKKPNIGMIIIAIDLPDEINEFLVDFKLNNRRPLIIFLPDLFETNIEKRDFLLNKILKIIGKLIS
ncbi:MAG: V-type ATP synthase subunit F [Candidatus Hodarchaeota archaeon]